MSKKKIATLLIAGVLTVSVVGGTLAWFTSSDNATNKFSTAGSSTDLSENSGIKIHENFNKNDAENITPGQKVTKEVQVHSTVNYPQFIRVKITPQFTDKSGAPASKSLDINKIQLNKNANVNNTKSDGTWFNGEDGYYYYIGKVGAESYTSTLLDSVTLASNVGNEYKNLGFEVKVDADSIQASNKAYESWNIPQDLKSIYEKLEGAEQTTPKNDEITSIPVAN